jgi:hypothetical protein
LGKYCSADVRFVIPGGRRVIFAALGILDRCLVLGVEIADDFTVLAEVMLKPFDA